MSYSLAISQAIAIMMYISMKMLHGKHEYLSTRYISENLNIPAPSVTKILKFLHTSNLIITKEGAGGGILLAKNPEDITILDIFISIENEKPLFKMPYLDAKNDTYDRLKGNLTTALNQAELSMKESLKNKTLLDLINEDK